MFGIAVGSHTAAETPYPHDTRIAGQLDGVFASGSGGFEARGWACTTGQDTHVNVDLYAGASHPAGAFLGRYAANRTSEPAVANACAAFGSAYRFAIPIVDATRDAHGGKSLHVHGMSPAGKENTVIAGSGAHAIPRLPPVVAPTGLSVPAQSGTGGYTVTWSASARATLYRLEESTNGGAWIVVHDGAATSKAVAGNGAGTYRYRVTARNEAGIGPTSSTAQVEVVVPSTPRITYSEREQAGTGKDALVNCSVMWTSVPHATRYELQDPASGQVQYNGASTSLFGSRQQYCAASHVVRACNTVGCSAWSGPPFKQVQTVIGSPTLKGE